MTPMWLVSTQQKANEDNPPPNEAFDTEAEAEAHAAVVARTGRVAVVWRSGVTG